MIASGMARRLPTRFVDAIAAERQLYVDQPIALGGVLVAMWPKGGALLLATVALVAATVGRAQEFPGKLATDCASLKDLAIPASAIALPTSGALVQSAERVARDAEKNVNGDFCKVTGVIKNATASTSVFEFEVNLPNIWNGRAVQFGGGGYDGSLVTGLTVYSNQPRTADTPLKQGYVTLGSNGGHRVARASTDTSPSMTRR